MGVEDGALGRIMVWSALGPTAVLGSLISKGLHLAQIYVLELTLVLKEMPRSVEATHILQVASHLHALI